MRFRYTLLIFFCAALMIGFTLGELAEKRVVEQELAKHHLLDPHSLTVPTSDDTPSQAAFGC